MLIHTRLLCVVIFVWLSFYQMIHEGKKSPKNAVMDMYSLPSDNLLLKLSSQLVGSATKNMFFAIGSLN